MSIETLLVRIGILLFGVVLGLGGLVFLARLRQKRVPSSIVIVLLGTLLLVALLLFTSGFLHSPTSRVRAWLEFGVSLGVSFLVLKVADLFLIEDYLIARRGAYIPDVVRILILMVGMTAAGLVSLRLVMNINVIALVALPTVATAVIGVAMRDTVVRFFSGIVLGKMIRIGDWITVMDKEGMVTHIDFGHVTLQTEMWDYVVLPNDKVIDAGLTNYSRPTTVHGCSIFVEAAYRTPPGQVCAVLTEAASAVKEVLSDPPPEAMVEAFRDSGIQYRLRFWITDYSRHERFESEMMIYVWGAFQRNSIEIPFPQRVVQTLKQEDAAAKMRRETDQLVAYLAKIDFFSILAQEQLARLASHARIQEFLSGERVVREGEPGQDLFIILDGRAEVRVQQDSRSSTTATLQTGQFFGEMSLLTGEPRSATVVAVTPLRVVSIGKESLGQVVQQDGNLVDRISEVVARRQAETLATREKLSREGAPVARTSQARSLGERIRRFLWDTL